MRVVSVITPGRPCTLERLLKQAVAWDRYPPRPPPSCGLIFPAAHGDAGEDSEEYEYVPVDRFPAAF